MHLWLLSGNPRDVFGNEEKKKTYMFSISLENIYAFIFLEWFYSFLLVRSFEITR